MLNRSISFRDLSEIWRCRSIDLEQLVLDDPTIGILFSETIDFSNFQQVINHVELNVSKRTDVNLYQRIQKWFKLLIQAIKVAESTNNPKEGIYPTTRVYKTHEGRCIHLIRVYKTDNLYQWSDHVLFRSYDNEKLLSQSGQIDLVTELSDN